ncbi:hypothetical protein QMK19_35240 [Streptomyces sp. H10-C2]|uniref:hypothetical protein n=1 Tax=unclassified Streptomyces TaxID=2593676 RepID=UPI0024B87CA1|nr:MULTISPECIES: hypothetical protein [unclassified Streptomyces]MDJ0345890.1 hypothetical protein [Streptomyces sp. PH10-H1]MDJ0374739.1 hypothetical protein [Streptomyces sp. H10-C2]
MSDEQLPALEVEHGEWYRAVPPPAVPMPAAQMPPDLHGKPAIAVTPGHGLLADLRVLGSVRRDPDGSAWVDVVTEADYWRTQISPGSVTQARPVRLDHLWIEHRLEPDDRAQVPGPAGDPQALLRRLAPGPDSPGARTPVPARTVPHLHGRRIIQTTPLGWAWDLRAVTEPYEDDQGDILVNLTSAHDFYRWQITGHPPDVVPCGLYLCWTE